MSEEIVRALIRVVREIIALKVKSKRKKGRWVREWIVRRNNLGASNTLLKELTAGDPKCYTNSLRIDEEMFNILLDKVASRIQKQDTVMRNAIPAKLKLQIALRNLATGDSLASLQYLYGVPKCTISKFLPEVFQAIYDALQEYIQSYFGDSFERFLKRSPRCPSCQQMAKVPRTEKAWKKIAEGFNSKWNFPFCIGAIDGKHIVIQCPPNSGSQYYNYKGQFSIVLLALVDDNYNFICIDIGSYGSHSDGGIFAKSSLMEAIETNQLNIPSGSIVVGGDAFPLKTYLMKPYPRYHQQPTREKVYNYRHCRARRSVENAFGILASRFRIFGKPILLAPDKVVQLIKAACAIHNWIRKSRSNKNPITIDIEDHEAGKIIPGSWRADPRPEGLLDLCSTQERNYTAEACQTRDKLAEYFVGEGAVDWQCKMI